MGVLLLGAPWLSTADARLARRPRAGLLAYDVQATCQAYLARVQEVLAPAVRPGGRGEKGPRAWRRLNWPSLRLGMATFVARLSARLRWLTSAQQHH